MDITLFGVRGSIPSPSESTHFYGANTPCVEMRTAGGDLFIFDAGSGIRALGESLPDKGECRLFISHWHMDHTTGLGFFRPLFLPGWTVHLYLPAFQPDLLVHYFDGNIFPLRHDQLKADIRTALVNPGDTFTIDARSGPVGVRTYMTNHPGGNIAYKITANGATFLYSGDHEITDAPEVQDLTLEMLTGSDLAVVDAHFSRTTYVPGWGHSAWEDWIQAAARTDAQLVVLSHHAPDRADAELDAIQTSLAGLPGERLAACVGREGMCLHPNMSPPPQIYTSDWLQDFINTIGQFKEESVILDAILHKTREVTSADAGTVFLYEEQDHSLVFAYTHNDSLFPVNESSKYAYASIRLPCSVESIAGYVAVTKQILNLPDVRDLPPNAPYSFNDRFDHVSGYVTTSTLTIPLLGRNQRLLGVMQLINSLDPRSKKPRPFTPEMERTVKFLAMEASKILELSTAITDDIYRLLRIAALHDPTETGPHAERVGAIAAEIYQVWAQKNGIGVDETLHYRSHLRLASMVHDIGKVGISDTILKKPGRLNAAEFAIIKTHTQKGAELFDGQFHDIPEMVRDIALHHHQKWDGTGYGEQRNAPLRGAEIPLAARITAIADVFDALVSPRCYKVSWSFEDAAAHIKAHAGRHFDPELTECFMSILDTVYLIYQRFPENLSIFPAGEKREFEP